jgi:proteic killer suppression protein
MILSFRSKETEKIWNLESVRKIPLEVQKTGLRKLVMLNKSIDVNDLLIPPGNRLEKLKGDREGEYSIRINDQWRVCFIWQNGNALEVEIVDYH